MVKYSYKYNIPIKSLKESNLFYIHKLTTFNVYFLGKYQRTTEIWYQGKNLTISNFLTTPNFLNFSITSILSFLTTKLFTLCDLTTIIKESDFCGT